MNVFICVDEWCVQFIGLGSIPIHHHSVLYHFEVVADVLYISCLGFRERLLVREIKLALNLYSPALLLRLNEMLPFVVCKCIKS